MITRYDIKNSDMIILLNIKKLHQSNRFAIIYSDQSWYVINMNEVFDHFVLMHHIQLNDNDWKI